MKKLLHESGAAARKAVFSHLNPISFVKMIESLLYPLTTSDALAIGEAGKLILNNIPDAYLLVLIRTV